MFQGNILVWTFGPSSYIWLNKHGSVVCVASVSVIQIYIIKNSVINTQSSVGAVAFVGIIQIFLR